MNCASIDLYPTSTGGKWCATFAMLVGVLVVAFPVSVFSDLWSNELKQVQGFDSLEDDDNRTQPNEPRESPSSQHGTSQKNRAADSDVVVINKQDLREIAECLCTIRENEHRVKAILHKYHHVDQF